MKITKKSISLGMREIIRNATSGYYRKKYSREFTGAEYSLITSNCIGGIINNRLGQPQNSPTVNLWFTQADFIKFVLKLKYYIDQELVFVNDNDEYSYPVATLDDIKIYFQHYHSEQEAQEEWEKRKKRIIWNRIFVVLYEKEISRGQLMQLLNVNCKSIVVLTSKKDNLDLPFMKYIEEDKHHRDNSFVYLDFDFLEHRTFEKQWDFVEWLNQ